MTPRATRHAAATVLLLFSIVVPADAQSITLTRILSGLDRPVSITHAGDAGRLFITLQPGLVMIYDIAAKDLLPTPFLDIRSLVLSGGERGLLSVAFDPQYATNGRFFVNYTERPNGTTVIARYTVSTSNPNRADPSSATEILRIAQPFSNHNGGQLQFGPDGYLYIGAGDGGSGGDPGNRAQNLSDLLGKMLRIDVSTIPYTIPASNPFRNVEGARDEIWARGLRNPWRFSFDRATGDLWIADVGQGDWEEVNFQAASSNGGENYGWRLMEGTHCFNPSSNCNDGSLVLPVIEYGHSGGACSVTGGFVYRGSVTPAMRGMYLYGDYCNGRIWGATRNLGGGVSTSLLADTNLLISTFGEDAQGEIYVADHNGAIWQINRPPDPPPPTYPKRRSVRK
jgi:glucose/arabinose dehydrogenase